MDEIDRWILNRIQSDFPVVARPYSQLAEELQVSADDILKRVRILKEKGIIRRIGAGLDSRKLNFASTLCAARVPQSKVDDFAAVVNRHPGVTHNYLRKNEYNVWFTLITADKREIGKIIEEIGKKSGVRGILNLPSVRTFKIKVEFEF